MASTLAVPMQLNSAKVLGSAISCLTLARPFCTSYWSSSVLSTMLRPWMPPRAFTAAKAAWAPWCMADPSSPNGPVRSVLWPSTIWLSCALAEPACNQGKATAAVPASSVRRDSRVWRAWGILEFLRLQ